MLFLNVSQSSLEMAAKMYIYLNYCFKVVEDFKYIVDLYEYIFKSLTAKEIELAMVNILKASPTSLARKVTAKVLEKMSRNLNLQNRNIETLHQNKYSLGQHEVEIGSKTIGKLGI